jgi:hypothetical protein
MPVEDSELFSERLNFSCALISSKFSYFWISIDEDFAIWHSEMFMINRSI